MTRDELQRLITLIVSELSAAQTQRASRCACHAVTAECCPNRLQGVIDAGATRVGVLATGGAPQSVASMIDHTLLKADATRQEIEHLCREAAQFKFATVCVNPVWVATAARLLNGSGVGVCSVVGFPLGATTGDVKAYETRRAIYDGAREIDMVINVGALKSKDYETVFEDICRVDVYVRHMEHFDGIHKVRREYFQPPLPASTMVEVSKMVSPDYLIEISAIAVLPDA